MSVRPFHHQRPLAAAAGAYGLGVWAGVSFAWRPALWIAGVAAACGIALLLPRVGRRRIVGVMAAALFLGALLGGWAGHPAVPDDGAYQVTGVLSADAVLREDGTAAGYLENVCLTNENGEQHVSRVYWTYTPDEDSPFLPREGESVSFSGRLYHPRGQENPYGFDFRMFLLQKGVTAGVTGASEAIVTDRPGRGLASLLYGLRQRLDARLQAVFGPDSALPRALLLGQRDTLPQETMQSFSDAGVAHVLAVSGLHVALLAGVLLIPLRSLLPLRKRVIVLGAFLLCYCALLDFSAPVVRSALLVMILEARKIIRRSPDPLTALAAAFLVILVFRPLDLFSASFQLSFCAVLGMAAFRARAERRLSRLRPRFLRQGVSATVSATAGSILPTIQIFHRFSLIGLFVNPLICAAFSVLLPVYGAVLILGCISLPLGAALGSVMGLVTRAVIGAVQWLGALPFATVRVPFLPWYCVLAVVAALALCSRFTVWPGKRKAALAAALLALTFGLWRLTLCRDVQYVQLAMGQEDAALILDGSETVVIDAGAYGGDAASYLLSTGRKADRVILTHLHRDHCMGIRELLDQRVPIGAVYLPEGAEKMAVDESCLVLINELRETGIPVLTLRAGDEIELNRVHITVTWPMEGKTRPGQDANRFSLAMVCDLDGVRLFTAGDLTGDYEMYAAADADILKLSHHGSKSSNGADFLAAVSPRIALIPANGFSEALPHPEVLSRLRESGVESYNTGVFGALTLTIRNGEAELTPFLNAKEQP